MLALTGAGAAGLLAGCTGDDNGDGGGSNGGGDDNRFVTTQLAAQEDIQFNPRNITIPPEWDISQAVYASAVIESRTFGEYYPAALSDYTIDGDTLTVEVLEDLTWHNGDQVTAEDYVRSVQIGYIAGENVVDRLDSIEDMYAEDDTTAVFELNETYNPVALETNILSEHQFHAHEEHYAEFVERYVDAGSDDAREEVQADLAEFNLRGEDVEPYASGPFELETIDTQGVHFTTYEDYPWASIQQNLEENYDLDLSDYPDELNYDGQTSQFFGERPQLHQAAQNGNIDGGDGFEIDSEDEIANEYPEGAEYNAIVSGWNDAFVFNWLEGEHADMWRDERVRKAFAHILDYDGISHQYHGEYGVVDETFGGMTPVMEEEVSDDFLDSLTTYEEDWDRAEELLEDAGLTKEDDRWYKPDGELLEATWAAPSTVQWQQDGMEYAASNLNQFGIESTVEVIEGTTFFGQTLPNLDYELTRGFIGFSNIVSGWELSWLRYDGADESERPFANYLQEPYGEPGLEIPPIGEPDSDDTIEVDPVELYEELAHTTDEERVTEISETLAWAFNQTVPKLPGSAGVYGWFMMGDRWDYPRDQENDPLAGLMPFTYSLPQIGALARKEDS
ncbi:ABC transporter substrate-binding protein [Natrononativus amylolyticus]|uniref:ABC transporter substrate-binding protein n=1 Tax=Natrononativus amylolyticus TaxID=2963434 RepID=UPI0020CCF706|nr:ABC transporter substrate-binding protein [Natrononativus amylolyticus]